MTSPDPTPPRKDLTPVYRLAGAELYAFMPGHGQRRIVYLDFSRCAADGVWFARAWVTEHLELGYSREVTKAGRWQATELWTGEEPPAGARRLTRKGAWARLPPHDRAPY